MNEEMLCQVFGKFGALASVKVMWPRTDEEKARDHNCGFVAYMKREQATQALNELKGTKLLDFPVQLGWGKPVPLPLNPVYVHPDLIKIQVRTNSYFQGFYNTLYSLLRLIGTHLFLASCPN